MRKVVGPAMQQEKASLRRNRHTDLIGDREAGTSLEAFFGKKNLDVTKEFCAVGRGHFLKKNDMALNHLQPFFRKWPRSQATSPPLLQELKNHDAM
jgi:hypothetical protein